MTRALLLTDTIAPEACGAAREAMRTLGVDDEIELFQSPSAIGTARIALHGGPVGVEFMGDYLSSLDRGGLLAVIGHEIGHAVAHCRTAQFAWARSAARSTYPSREMPFRKAYAIATEMTADCFGLLACRDIDAVLRVEMLGAAGSAGSKLHLDARLYLKQCRAVTEEILAEPTAVALGTSHPEHYVRGYVEWLFSETDLYASLSGNGPGTRAVEEVDAVIAKLLGLESHPSAARSHTADGFVIKAPPPKQGAHAPSEEGAQPPLEALAVDILTDGARRKVEATGKALAHAANAVVPTLQRLAGSARTRVGHSRIEKDVEDAKGPTSSEATRDLRASFEEFVRKRTK